MTTTIDLPDNQHATFKTADELSNREVKLLRRAARKVGVSVQKLKDLGFDATKTTDVPDDEDEAVTAERNQSALAIFSNLSDDEDDNLDLFQRECAAVRLVEWTLDLPLPKTADDVDNLPRPIYNALTAEAAKLDLSETFDKEASLDPKEVEAPNISESSD
jgi:hypothetical protein